ncbi:hypothetical protein HGG82_07265 [Marinomonas sp. M1K-6]|uniref:dUTPase-like domain-containing protein n=1 Tax=Marinomonas profundi TaxID=2726122 RepID=A0A847R907_9GAMM|nr:hypothetical protein [Marinomonas profundi]NLQ17424.1 hypothetical protein [Marinomonas profundi]UDV01949.1 hypothetical protein J8N69_10045 [Marinomonas profundi]
MILNSNLNACGVRIRPEVVQSQEKVSVDLSVGSLYQRSGDTDWLKINKNIILQPGSCIIIETQESISMPNNVFGLLSTKGSIGSKGIVTANTKLDPLFVGKLRIPVFNVSGRKVELHIGQAFCSMSFWRTEAPIVGTETRTAIKTQPKTENWLKDYWGRYSAQILTGVFSILGSIIAAIITVTLGK